VERAHAEAWFRGLKTFKAGVQDAKKPLDRTIELKELEKLEGCRVNGVHVFKGDGDGKGNYGVHGDFWKGCGASRKFDGTASLKELSHFLDALKRKSPEVYAQVSVAMFTHTELAWEPVTLTMDKLHPADRAALFLCKVLKTQVALNPLIPERGEGEEPAILGDSPLLAVRDTPASLHDGATGVSLTEGMLPYIASQYGAHNGFAFYPDPKDRTAGKRKALIDQLLLFHESKLAGVVAGWVAPQVDLKRSEDMSARALLEAPCGYLEELLEAAGGARFLTGDELSVADIAIACTLGQLELVQDALTGFPLLEAWTHRVAEACNALDGNACHWNDAGAYLEGVKGTRLAALANERLGGLYAHPEASGIRGDVVFSLFMTFTM